jgi:hypothetical protein
MKMLTEILCQLHANYMRCCIRLLRRIAVIEKKHLLWLNYVSKMLETSHTPSLRIEES